MCTVGELNVFPDSCRVLYARRILRLLLTRAAIRAATTVAYTDGNGIGVSGNKILRSRSVHYYLQLRP